MSNKFDLLKHFLLSDHRKHRVICSRTLITPGFRDEVERYRCNRVCLSLPDLSTNSTYSNQYTPHDLKTDPCSNIVHNLTVLLSGLS